MLFLHTYFDVFVVVVVTILIPCMPTSWSSDMYQSTDIVGGDDESAEIKPALGINDVIVLDEYNVEVKDDTGCKNMNN